jgi:ketosteroid isomerase-like protein
MTISAQDEALKASEKFYAALNRLLEGDAGPMSDSWSHSAAVTTMHPLGGQEFGWPEVRKSFEQVGKLASGGRVTLADRHLQVVGDVAYETGIERGQAKLGSQQFTIDQRVTNIYSRESGTWKIVHHHTDTSAAMVEFARNAQARTPVASTR